MTTHATKQQALLFSPSSPTFDVTLCGGNGLTPPPTHAPAGHGMLFPATPPTEPKIAEKPPPNPKHEDAQKLPGCERNTQLPNPPTLPSPSKPTRLVVPALSVSIVHSLSTCEQASSLAPTFGLIAGCPSSKRAILAGFPPCRLKRWHTLHAHVSRLDPQGAPSRSRAIVSETGVHARSLGGGLSTTSKSPGP